MKDSKNKEMSARVAEIALKKGKSVEDLCKEKQKQEKHDRDLRWKRCIVNAHMRTCM